MSALSADCRALSADLAQSAAAGAELQEELSAAAALQEAQWRENSRLLREREEWSARSALMEHKIAGLEAAAAAAGGVGRGAGGR